MSALSTLVDVLIAAFILHQIGWIDVSLPNPILYRGGNSAIVNELEATEPEQSTQGQPEVSGDSPFLIEATPTKSTQSDG